MALPTNLAHTPARYLGAKPAHSSWMAMASCLAPVALQSTTTDLIFAIEVALPALHFCSESVHFCQPIASSVLKCMFKKLREIFIFGKVIDVQSLTFSASGGGGGCFNLKELPHAAGAIWRKFVSITLRRDTCWLLSRFHSIKQSDPKFGARDKNCDVPTVNQNARVQR